MILKWTCRNRVLTLRTQKRTRERARTAIVEDVLQLKHSALRSHQVLSSYHTAVIVFTFPKRRAVKQVTEITIWQLQSAVISCTYASVVFCELRLARFQINIWDYTVHPICHDKFTCENATCYERNASIYVFSV